SGKPAKCFLEIAASIYKQLDIVSVKSSHARQDRIVSSDDRKDCCLVALQKLK
ncbi:5100_t:CDS:1, partial [Dentiscutata erythropus]